jgi:hypothetical protein
LLKALQIDGSAADGSATLVEGEALAAAGETR